MLNDFIVFIRIKKVRCDPLGLSVVDILKGVHENILPVYQASNNANVAFRISFDKRLKELNEPFNSIPNSGTVLGVPISRVFGYSLSCIPVPDSFHVEVGRIFKFFVHDLCVFFRSVKTNSSCWTLPFNRCKFSHGELIEFLCHTKPKVSAILPFGAF